MLTNMTLKHVKCWTCQMGDLYQWLNMYRSNTFIRQISNLSIKRISGNLEQFNCIYQMLFCFFRNMYTELFTQCIRMNLWKLSLLNAYLQIKLIKLNPHFYLKCKIQMGSSTYFSFNFLSTITIDKHHLSSHIY